MLPDARRAPGAARLGDPRRQPAARRALRAGGGRCRRPEPRDPGRRRRRGRRGGRRDAARGRGGRGPARHRAARAQLHGRRRLDDQQLDLHRRRQPLAPARPRRGARAVGQRHRRVPPRARARGSGTAGSCPWAPRWSSTCATTSPTASTTPRPTPSCCSSRASSGPSCSSPCADRALQLGKPILAVKVGRSAQAQAAAVAHSGSLAGEDRVTSAALDAAGVIRCADLDELLEAAELVAGIGRLGRRLRGGRTGVVTVSTGEASLVADLADRTGIDLPPVTPGAREAILRDLPTMGYIGNPLDPVGRGRRGDRVPGVVRGDGGVGRVRRARDRARQPVSASCRARWTWPRP